MVPSAPAWQVVAVHEVMMSCGHTPDAGTAALVLNAAMQAGQMQKAFGLAHSLQARQAYPA
jgi:hypothetical protein